MGKKKIVNPNERPHPILEAMLQGPTVPKGFKCDGCTSSPDLHFVWACNIHDYESKMSSENWGKLMKAVGSDQDTVSIQVYKEEEGRYVPTQMKLKYGFEIWFKQFEGMARRLKLNIRILSRFDIKDGNLVSRSRMNPKRFLGYKLSRLYAKATKDWFSAWAE